MGENVTNGPQNSDISVNTDPPKRRIRIGYVFLSVVPVAVLMAVQTLAQIPFLIMSCVDVIKGTDQIEDLSVFFDAAMSTFNEKYTVYMYLVYSVAGLIIFSIWYFKGFVKKNPKVKIGEVFGVKSVLAAVCIAVGLYFSINALMILVEWVLPVLIEMYNMMIEAAGVATDTIIVVAYTILLGPILEELCFRGVTFAILEKSGIKPRIVILISSLFFGAMHLIPVQVFYATIVAFFLGYLRYKYRSIMITVFTHILFNFFGSYVSGIFENLGLSDGIMLILGGLALFILVIAIVLVNGDKKAYKPLHNS